jgi:hypothetical protein
LPFPSPKNKSPPARDAMLDLIPHTKPTLHARVAPRAMDMQAIAALARRGASGVLPSSPFASVETADLEDALVWLLLHKGVEHKVGAVGRPARRLGGGGGGGGVWVCYCAPRGASALVAFVYLWLLFVSYSNFLVLFQGLLIPPSFPHTHLNARSGDQQLGRDGNVRGGADTLVGRDALPGHARGVQQHVQQVRAVVVVCFVVPCLPACLPVVGLAYVE